jgi:hypothetical protein
MSPIPRVARYVLILLLSRSKKKYLPQCEISPESLAGSYIRSFRQRGNPLIRFAESLLREQRAEARCDLVGLKK